MKLSGACTSGHSGTAAGHTRYSRASSRTYKMPARPCRHPKRLVGGFVDHISGLSGQDTAPARPSARILLATSCRSTRQGEGGLHEWPQGSSPRHEQINRSSARFRRYKADKCWVRFPGRAKPTSPGFNGRPTALHATWRRSTVHAWPPNPIPPVSCCRGGLAQGLLRRRMLQNDRTGWGAGGVPCQQSSRVRQRQAMEPTRGD